MEVREKQQEAFSKVLMALIDAKKVSQRQLAMELDTSPSNFNQRILAGSMRPYMIMHLNEILNVDLIQLVHRHYEGEPLSNVIDYALNNAPVFSKPLGKSSPNANQTIKQQAETIKGLQTQIKQLMAELNQFIKSSKSAKSSAAAKKKSAPLKKALVKKKR
jgi:hypothetical protein